MKPEPVPTFPIALPWRSDLRSGAAVGSWRVEPLPWRWDHRLVGPLAREPVWRWPTAYLW